MKMELPAVLFSSSSDSFRPQEFVKNILKVSELPQSKVVSDDIEGYEWFFETKYYSTTVNLCTTDKRTIGDKDFADSVQAFIHFFDPNIPSSFDLAKAWLPYLSHIEPDIRILVCNTSQDSDAVARQVILEWCIKNAFELVELNPAEDSEDEDNDFPETTGLARIVQALYAHTWSNMKMKNSGNISNSCLRHMMKEQDMLNNQHQIFKAPDEYSSEFCQHSQTSTAFEQFNSDCHLQKLAQNSEARNVSNDKNADFSASYSADGIDTDKLNKVTSLASDQENILQLDGIEREKSLTDNDKEMSLPLSVRHDDTTSLASDLENILQLDGTEWEKLLTDTLSDEHDDVGEFEQLFMKLKMLKDEAENLPPEQRKQYAEKVAISFWKAIGGDEDEIDGLDEEQYLCLQ